MTENGQIYFEGFVKGADLILPKPVKAIYGRDYDQHKSYITDFTKRDRNKIFHGQITANGLSGDDLLEHVSHIKTGCKTLSDTLNIEIGYGGFGKSYRKSKAHLALKNLEQFNTIPKYKLFLRNELALQRRARK